ncbi:hypothetical protein HOD61_01155 [archaeon]|nr:hypothetical protein [archaeon]
MVSFKKILSAAAIGVGLLNCQVNEGINRPDYGDDVRALYVPNNIVYEGSNKLETILDNTKLTEINGLVLDVQPWKGYLNTLLDSCHASDIYTIARIHTFHNNKQVADSSVWKNRVNLAKKAAENGFDEVQFDYIRYRDSGKRSVEKNNTINSFLNYVNEELKDYDIKISADIFGRIPFTGLLDRTGQSITGMDDYADVICPMLYHSHFYGNQRFMDNPDITVKEGVKKSLKIVDEDTKIRPWIQGFGMGVKDEDYNGDYMLKQINGAYDGGVDGYVIWNIHGNYDILWEGLGVENGTD